MTARTAKIACSLDADLLASVERLRARSGESRSAVIARALADLVGARERELATRAYVKAYQDQPETAPEIREARGLARRSLSRVSWDEP
jgi:predicted transcriptional regulator